jgi:hypothetical protein
MLISTHNMLLAVVVGGLDVTRTHLLKYVVLLLPLAATHLASLR